jgi:hypothetical protein
MLEEMRARGLDEGEDAYLISADWLTAWRVFTETGAPNPGPVDNSALVAGSGDDAAAGDDAEGAWVAVNADAWRTYVDIYGGGPEVRRAARGLVGGDGGDGSAPGAEAGCDSPRSHDGFNL